MFTLFNQLPAEIRFQIWEAALPDPRVSNIRERLVRKTKLGDRETDSSFESSSPKSADNNTLSSWSDSIVPSKLFACRESRQVALKFYVKSFAFANLTPEDYVDFEVDTMYLRFSTFAKIDTSNWLDDFMQQLESMYNSDGVHRVQKLAILLDLEENKNYHRQLAQVWRWFGNVQELKVVVSDFDHGNDDRGVIIYVEPFDATKTCRNYETFAPESACCHEIPDILFAMIFVFAMELDRELRRR